jgi:stearoyl-CoA desaturase (delta-9 desaturase)
MNYGKAFWWTCVVVLLLIPFVGADRFYGVLDLSWWGYIVVGLAFTHITIASVTIFLHRAQAHRALTLHPIVSHFFRLWLWLSTGMETKAWAAIHRKHHAYCETDEDPHSPQVLGLSTVLKQGAELYRREAKNTQTLERFGQGTPDDWLERHVYTPHSAKGILLMLCINLWLFGIPGLSIWALQMAWIPLTAAGVINGIGHYYGYRSFDCADASTNIIPWGILIGGEELHNNHHTYPTSAKLSVQWWEFDLGWFYIKTLALLGLATVKRTVPMPKIIPGKSTIDAEGLRALLSNRVQVMTTYSKAVIRPLVKIKQEDALRSAYHFREQLILIWSKTTASQKELLDALQEWCTEAEATGIQKLQDFARYLKGYSIPLMHTV